VTLNILTPGESAYNVTRWSYDQEVTLYAQTDISQPPRGKTPEVIIDAAIEEFAEYGLENASTNRIVANSGISKGSFYQYFEDKQDVFMYLLSVLEREKLEYFKGKHPPSANMDTFGYFRWMIKTGMEFNSSHPSWCKPSAV
jgi:hypothetical protein